MQKWTLGKPVLKGGQLSELFGFAPQFGPQQLS